MFFNLLLASLLFAVTICSISTSFQNVSINETTGEVSMLLDREAIGGDGQIFLSLVASDNGQPPRTGMAALTINVQGENDNLPYFEDDKNNVTLYIDEGTINRTIFVSNVSWINMM